jgi:carbon storage regulator
MLVLSRQKDEKIVIGDCITVTIVDIRGDKVRLGIDAPREVPVHRKEVFDAIKREEERKGPWARDEGSGTDGAPASPADPVSSAALKPQA